VCISTMREWVGPQVNQGVTSIFSSCADSSLERAVVTQSGTRCVFPCPCITALAWSWATWRAPPMGQPWCTRPLPLMQGPRWRRYRTRSVPACTVCCTAITQICIDEHMYIPLPPLDGCSSEIPQSLQVCALLAPRCSTMIIADSVQQ
jgi:hypothetical protein